MIYVDDADIRHNGRRWFHMVADSEAELHLFASTILGLKREWYQGDHYDITLSKRRAALRNGAEAVTSREMVKLRNRLSLRATHEE